MSNRLRVAYHFLLHRNTKKYKSQKEIVTYQNKKLRLFFSFLVKHSKYYKDRFPQGIKGLAELPIMDKKMMMDNFDNLVTVDVTKDEAFQMAINSERTREFGEKLSNITVGLSSGTSHHRGLFLASHQEADTWTGVILARLLPNMKGVRDIAFFLRANSNLYENVGSKGIKFTYYDIYKDMVYNIKKLKDHQPNILVAPPSVLMVLAQAVEDKKLSLDLEKVVSVAEVLEEADADYFRNQFGQEIIHQVYQCTEGFLGYTCEHGTIHINEDIVHIEKEHLDKKRFIPIITDFTRRSQPIVRYRLNDVLVLKDEPCSCGCSFMALEKIEGREDDVFIFEDLHNADEEVKVFPDIIRRCLLYVDGIINYQVIQHSKYKIQVLLDPRTMKDQNGIEQTIRCEFKRIAETFRFKMPEIDYGIYIHQTKTKLKRVIRL